MALETDDIKFEDMFRKHNYALGAVLSVGDGLQIPCGMIPGTGDVINYHYKMIKVNSLLNIENMTSDDFQITAGWEMRVLTRNTPAVVTIIIETPPANWCKFSASPVDISFPSNAHPDRISSLRVLWKALITVTGTSPLPTPTKGLWFDIMVYRDGQELGSLSDVHLAHQMAKNEHDFLAQMMFCAGHYRELSPKACSSSFYMVANSSLL